MTDEKRPEVVEKIAEVVSHKLGRSAIIRKVNNQDGWYVQDLAFSYFQKADRNHNVGYRAGFFFGGTDEENVLSFTLVHSPVMANFFRKNFDYTILREILIKTSKYRDKHILVYDGWYRGQKRKANQIQSAQLNEFLEELDDLSIKGFQTLLFPKTISTGKDKSKKAVAAGNWFDVVLGQGISPRDAAIIIDKSWQLFLWLYPSKPLFKRAASLNRSMRKIEQKCEFLQISNLPEMLRKTPCNGVVQAAHIKAHVHGGSDKAENGLWLCQHHHRLTEQRISGHRTSDKIHVKYIH